jgi:excisionase family DNA binding protein
VTAPLPEPTVFTVKDLAHYLKVHQSTIYRLLRTAELPCFRVGRMWRFHREAIDRWIEERPQGHTRA